MKQVPVCICLHDDSAFVKAVFRSFEAAGPLTALVSKRAWDSSEGDWARSVRDVEAAGAEAVVGDWPDESLHRRAALELMRARGHTHVLIPDGDEIAEPRLLEHLLQIADQNLADIARVRMNTYWSTPDHVIRPREELAPILLINCQTCDHTHIREYEGGRTMLLSHEYGVLHHLSYVASSDARIKRKISTWGHRNEVSDHWFHAVWQGWKADPTLGNLHPTHPRCYGFVERVPRPEILAGIEPYAAGEPPVPVNWPKISVVIPLYGGPDDIRACLESLAACGDLLHEVIVVDDASPDDAAQAAESFPFVNLLRNEANLGFAATCNRGYEASNRGCEASSSDVLLFLNSDTRVPRAGLIRLMETLMESGTVGAAGPHTNNAGYDQPISPTYTDIGNLELFAQDFATRQAEDREVSMLVGFCLAVRRSVLEEVGSFDTRYGKGLFEDTDIIYRIQRAGFKTLLSARAYVHHEGSKSLNRCEEHPTILLDRNRRIFEDEWREDLEFGFASHLAGQRSEPTVFNEERRPDRVKKEIARLAEIADISLCMIVRSEKRVLGACLESTRGAFRQTIIVDTGSTDGTQEIAKEFGAELVEIEWPNSFAAARNVSLSYARCKWVFWMDADDTLPLATVESILHAAIEAPADVMGFVVPVQFVDQGPNGGTRVDHVKLFRNIPGLQFEGHIHEQILPSIRAHGGDVRRLDAVVLHSGYDSSAEGQKRKRIRDRKLLLLDLKDRPTHPFVLFNLGMTDHFTGRHKSAIGWLERCIRHSAPGESHVRKAYALLGTSERLLGRPEAAIKTFRRGVQVVGDDPELRFQTGLTLSNLGRLQEARAEYLAVGTDTSGFFSSVDIGILTFKRLHNLGHVCEALGLLAEAKQHWLEAIRSNPGFTPSAVSLFECGLQTGDIAAAIKAAQLVYLAEHESDLWIQMRVRIAEARGVPAEQELARLYAEKPYPVEAGIRLARMLLESGREEQAVQLLASLENRGVAEAAYHLGVACVRRRDLEGALHHTKLANQLGPGHEQTENQLVNIEAALEARKAAPVVAQREELLKGPHVGELGAASCRSSVIVVSFNSEGTLERCLQSVLESMGDDDELIVLDNGSSDCSPCIASKVVDTDPRVRAVFQTENLGYAKGCNTAMLTSKGRFLISLNPDAYVFQGWIEGLTKKLGEGIAAVGPLSDRIGGDQFVGHYLGERHPALAELPGIFSAERPGESLETKLLMGVCLAMRREVLDEHGLFDETTELGADDLEFCWRMSQLQCKLLVALDTFVQHEKGQSFASLSRVEVRRRICRSDNALLRKLIAYYDPEPVPTSMEIWGSEIFTEAMSRRSAA